MNGDTTQPTLTANEHLSRIAQGLSMALHPFLIPLYLLLVLFLSGSIYSYYPWSVKAYLVGVVLLFSWVVPGISILILRHFGLLDNLRITERRERIIPLLVGAISYLICALVFARIPSTLLIHKMMIGATGCCLFALITTLHWKVSLHLTCLGGATAAIAILGIASVGEMTLPLILAILSSGLLASARLYLGHHTGLQILVGYGCGFALMSLALLLL